MMPVLTASPPTTAPRPRVDLSPRVRRPLARLPRHLPALDGVRALAVLAVLAYHFGVAATPGGLLGVDVFFVLSGFLITSLLLDEWQRTGRINLARFWGRRARRLLPALLLVLTAVSAYVAFLADPSDRIRLRGDALATLGYVANWHFALSGQDYFANLGQPSPLLHTWSLAVEEQFYLFWPLLVLLVLRRSSRRGTSRAVGLLACAGAAVSTGWMALLAIAGVGASRLYYGTDTRFAALLVGAALAAAAPTRLVHGTGRPARRGRAAFAVLGVLGLVALAYAVTQLDGQDPRLYRGGFLLVALAAAALLAGVTAAPRLGLARLLSAGPLVWVGRLSYGIYLWHWPAEIVLNRARTGLSGPVLFAVRVAATMAVAAASYYLVERPVRRRSFAGWSTRTGAFAALAATVAAVIAGPMVTNSGSRHAPTLARDVVRNSHGQVTATTAPDVTLPPVQPLTSGSTAPRVPLGHQLSIQLVGDSLATTLGWGLGPDLTTYRANLWLDAPLGCGILSGPHWDRGQLIPDPPECVGWQQRWRTLALQHPPDVFTILLGRWEMTDRLYQGQYRHLGDPVFDAYVKHQLETAAQVGLATGAPVVFLTTPCLHDPEQADGQPWPQDDDARRTRFIQLVREVAAEHPGDVTVLDLAGLLCPGGKFTPTIDGVQVRDPDGVHFTLAGAVWVGKSLIPALQDVAEEAAARRLAAATTPATTPGARPGATPSATVGATPGAHSGSSPGATAPSTPRR